MEPAADDEIFDVVVNHEEQYSIWPVGRELPRGWRTIGVRAPKAECLRRIEELWTDMRPLSLRRWMAEAERQSPPAGGPREGRGPG